MACEELKRARLYVDELKKAHAAFEVDKTSSHRSDKKWKKRYEEEESQEGTVESDGGEEDEREKPSSSQKQ